MKFKSALVTQASGSIGGFTAGSNKGGLYLRARAIPTNPNSTAQQEARSAMTESVNVWTSVLTAAQREAWRTYAANTPVVDVFGDAKLLTGQQMYIRSNSPRLRQSKASVPAGPTTFNLGLFTAVSFTVSEAAPNDIVVTFTAADAWANAVGAHLFIGISRGQNPSRDFFKSPFRQLGSIDGAATPPTSPATIASPFAYTEGQKVFAFIRASQDDARLSTAQIADTLVTA